MYCSIKFIKIYSLRFFRTKYFHSGSFEKNHFRLDKNLHTGFDDWTNIVCSDSPEKNIIFWASLFSLRFIPTKNRLNSAMKIFFAQFNCNMFAHIYPDRTTFIQVKLKFFFYWDFAAKNIFCSDKVWLIKIFFDQIHQNMFAQNRPNTLFRSGSTEIFSLKFIKICLLFRIHLDKIRLRLTKWFLIRVISTKNIQWDLNDKNLFRTNSSKNIHSDSSGKNISFFARIWMFKIFFAQLHLNKEKVRFNNMIFVQISYVIHIIA